MLLQNNHNYSGTNRLQGVTDAHGITAFSWDAEDTRFSYDPNGNLTKQTENGSDSYTYILDGAQTLAVMKDDTLRWWNIVGGGTEGRWEATSDSLRFYLTDHLGSTRAVTDQNGTIVETFDYYPFGLLMPKRNTENAGTTEKFSGKELDENTSQYYFGARYYNPALGRFLSTDRFAEKYPGMSVYQYAANNPAGLVDINGDSTWVIHGTDGPSSNTTSETFDKEGRKAWEEVLNDKLVNEDFNWTGGNSKEARFAAAIKLALKIKKSIDNGTETVNICWP